MICQGERVANAGASQGAQAQDLPQAWHALLRDRSLDAASVLQACHINMEQLRKELTDYIDKKLDRLATTVPSTAKPTTGFQRVVQRVILHIQVSGGGEVTGANVVVQKIPPTGHHCRPRPWGTILWPYSCSLKGGLPVAPRADFPTLRCVLRLEAGRKAAQQDCAGNK
jgi:hypothetical protein